MAARFPDESAVRQLITRTKEELDNRLAYSSNQNLITNWYLCDPVNQMGKNEYTSDGYAESGDAILNAIDGWIIVRGSMVLNDGGIHIDTQISSTPNGWLGSRILPDEFGIVGKTCVLSFLTNDELYSMKFTYPNRGGRVASTSIAEIGKMQVEWLANQSWSNVQLFVNKGKELDVIAVKLELGDRQTLARKIDGKWSLIDPAPDKTETLMKCKRLYQRHGLGLTAIMHGTQVRFQFPFDVPMRATPSVNLLNTSIKFIHSSKECTLNNAQIVSKGLDACGVRWIILSGTFDKNAPEDGKTISYNDQVPIFEFDAELN